MVLVFTLYPTCARAELRFTQPTADAGQVKCGVPLAHEFAFGNTGPGAVEIVEIQASCGCLRPQLEQRLYNVGEGSKLRIEVNTLTQAAGPHSWRTVVRYREGNETHEMALILTATLVAEISVQPSELVIFADHAVTHELRVTDSRAKPFTITAVQSTAPKLTLRLTDEKQDAEGGLTRTIRLDVAEDFPEGRHEETVEIHTDDPLYRDLKVPVRIVKRSRQRFTALPAEVALSAPRGQPIPSKIVLIRDSENGSIEIERLTPSDAAIGCTWARGPGGNATLRITVDRSRLSSDGLRGKVQVQIGKPAAETVTIPVMVATP
jgi:hypothetical protein